MATSPRFRVLVLCTGNSARSQMAEALFATLGHGRIEARSAGSHPAPRVHPLAVERLAEAGIDWRDRRPRGLDGLESEPWDLVLTVCDHAREHCPYFPAARARAHWSIPDPAAVEDDEASRRRAFDHAFRLLAERIEQLLRLPLETLSPVELAARATALAPAP
jgi:arsenate reductase